MPIQAVIARDKEAIQLGLPFWMCDTSSSIAAGIYSKSTVDSALCDYARVKELTWQWLVKGSR